MWLTVYPSIRVRGSHRLCNLARLSRRFASVNLDSKYSEVEKDKILKVINESDADALSRYEITKARLKSFSVWKKNNGVLKNLSDIGSVESFTVKTAGKLFDSILSGPVVTEKSGVSKIKGQVLQPPLSANAVKNCKTVLSVYITANSVSWTLIDKATYEVTEWKYHSIGIPDTKKLQISDILTISWNIVNLLPPADIYVMKAEATTLRAAGSDPNNPKVMAVNLQKAQMVAMIVALINARDSKSFQQEESIKPLNHKVYFLRPTLPFRLYGTLVGNEKVTTDQTVEMLLQSISQSESSNNSNCKISEDLKTMFRSQRDLERDMLGHCLLLSLTFMDLCVYKNHEKISKLLG